VQKRFSNDIADLLAPNSLSIGFVQDIWNGWEVSNKNKTKKMFNAFLRELRKRNLIAE
jgi:hypothetical protein